MGARILYILNAEASFDHVKGYWSGPRARPHAAIFGSLGSSIEQREMLVRFGRPVRRGVLDRTLLRGESGVEREVRVSTRCRIHARARAATTTRPLFNRPRAWHVTSRAPTNSVRTRQLKVQCRGRITADHVATLPEQGEADFSRAL